MLIGKATGMELPDRGQELRDTDQAVVATFVQARTPVCPRRFRPRAVSASSSLRASIRAPHGAAHRLSSYGAMSTV